MVLQQGVLICGGQQIINLLFICLDIQVLIMQRLVLEVDSLHTLYALEWVLIQIHSVGF